MNDNIIRTLIEAKNLAMEQCVKARIPECGEFAAIAQDLDWVVNEILFKQLPIEGSLEADLAIDNMLKERDYPTSSKQAARAGWRAARIYFDKPLKTKTLDKSKWHKDLKQGAVMGHLSEPIDESLIYPTDYTKDSN